jgi:hypothetical protein
MQWVERLFDHLRVAIVRLIKSFKFINKRLMEKEAQVIFLRLPDPHRFHSIMQSKGMLEVR